MPVNWPIAQPIAKYRRRDVMTRTVYDVSRFNLPTRTYSLAPGPWSFLGDELDVAGTFNTRTSDTTPTVTVDAKTGGVPSTITLQRVTPTAGAASTLPLVLTLGVRYQATYPLLPTGVYLVTIVGTFNGLPKTTTHTLIITGFVNLLARRLDGIMSRSGLGILAYRQD